jgi:uncharacterized membrane protein YgdD (TMEM256/DUF423 family)
MTWVMIGSAIMLTGVAVGAFGAHGLKARVSPDMLAVFETGVRYHLFHGLALFVVAWVSAARPAAAWAGGLFVAGIVIFSGSLYLLVLSDARWLGAVTPVGGLCFLAGWMALFVAAWP